jgi:hypothetical protein
MTNLTRVCSTTVNQDCLRTASANACYDSAYVAFHRGASASPRAAAASSLARVVRVAVPVALGGLVLAGAAILVPLAVRAKRKRAAAAAMTALTASIGAKASSQESNEYRQAWAT